jgi:hypothetical protein
VMELQEVADAQRCDDATAGAQRGWHIKGSEARYGSNKT